MTATSEVLFSGSKDGSAKIWDLTQGIEVLSLNDHPDAVNVVRYDEYNKLIFTCSKSVIKLWDPRMDPVSCIQSLSYVGHCDVLSVCFNVVFSLSSSGLVVDGSVNESNSIHDMRLNAHGSTMFCATEKLVRIFDLRTYQSIGKLNTGHKSLVTCLAVDEEERNDSRTVITGSKDHTVKVFELDANISGIHTPKSTLKPPHYDGIEALRLTHRGRFLFSGGRDGCIKKWDLSFPRMVATLSNCHRDWVLAIDTLMNDTVLLSGCRAGFLRVWDVEDCRSYGSEIQAHHAPINDIATIPQTEIAFTASGDHTINLWRYRDSNAIVDDTE